MFRSYIALIHHPVVDRTGREVTSSVTSLDMHDLARAARTYGIRGTFVVHPSAVQRRFVAHVTGHFVSGAGRRAHPERGETLDMQLNVVPDLDGAIEAIEAREGEKPLLVGTSAREGDGATGYGEMGALLRGGARPGLILFGTSWGLTPGVMDHLDFRLPPLRGREVSEYNHLSVRAAAAVILDRLFGDRETPEAAAAESFEEGARP